VGKLVALLLAAAFAASVVVAGAADDKGADKTPAADAKANKAEEKLDINTASDKDLAKLPGIGEARAAAVIKGRPYKGKDELVDRKILPKSVYDKIKDRIIAKQS
jgi:competence protein ComEA